MNDVQTRWKTKIGLVVGSCDTNVVKVVDSKISCSWGFKESFSHESVNIVTLSVKGDTAAPTWVCSIDIETAALVVLRR